MDSELMLCEREDVRDEHVDTDVVAESVEEIIKEDNLP